MKKHLTFTGKFLVAYFVIMLLIFILSLKVFGAEIDFEVKWAVNGMPADGGFRFYRVISEEDNELIFDITDSSQRVWNGKVTVNEGVNRFFMVTYLDELESERSDEFTYEWIEPDTPGGLPVPVVIINFNSN